MPEPVRRSPFREMRKTFTLYFRPIAPPIGLRHAAAISLGVHSFMSVARIIKKYPNRRLYDTEISSYITVDDVRQLVMDEELFEVRDAKTGQDLTRSVLLQIISEQEQCKTPVLSTPLLNQVIRFRGNPLQALLGQYMERSMQLFLEQQARFRKQMGNLLGQTSWMTIDQMVGEHDREFWQNLENNIDGENTAVQSAEASGSKA
jgi:polyhydroxyalkanoate synthesis repressor PhaR